MRTFISKTTTTSQTIIDIGINKQIQIYTLKLQLIGTTANTVTILEGSTAIDKYLLQSQGQTEGIAKEKPAYTLNSSLKISCSGTDEVGIFVDYETI